MGRGRRFLSSPKHPDHFWSHPVSYLVAAGSINLRVKQLGRESDRSSPPIAEINEWHHSFASAVYRHDVDGQLTFACYGIHISGYSKWQSCG